MKQGGCQQKTTSKVIWWQFGKQTRTSIPRSSHASRTSPRPHSMCSDASSDTPESSAWQLEHVELFGTFVLFLAISAQASASCQTCARALRSLVKVASLDSLHLGLNFPRLVAFFLEHDEVSTEASSEARHLRGSANGGCEDLVFSAFHDRAVAGKQTVVPFGSAIARRLAGAQYRK